MSKYFRWRKSVCLFLYTSYNSKRYVQIVQFRDWPEYDFKRKGHVPNFTLPLPFRWVEKILILKNLLFAKGVFFVLYICNVSVHSKEIWGKLTLKCNEKQLNPTCGMPFMLRPLFWITCWLPTEMWCVNMCFVKFHQSLLAKYTSAKLHVMPWHTALKMNVLLYLQILDFLHLQIEDFPYL